MRLHIRNPRAREVAAQLAELTGEDLSTAVIRALELSLDIERRKLGRNSAAERILDFADRFAPGMPAGCDSAGHGALLYGQDGLPR